MTTADTFEEAAIPLSLYVHIPWCVRKCPYCDFNSHALRGSDVPEAAYVAALLADLDSEKNRAHDRLVDTVFIGGGTPSLLSGAAVETLLAGIDHRLGFEENVEITIEANPGVSERGRYRTFREAGVNRLSIGAQSFSDPALERLGRIHDADDARASIDAAHGAGFDAINVDLMYALPGQSLADAEYDVREACDREPTHISHYQLTVEPNTLFARYPPTLPGEDPACAMLSAARDVLDSGGYTQYEVSAYAAGGYRCRHNMNYWEFGDYLGIGAGAHGKCTSDKVRRTSKQRQPRRYMSTAGSPEAISGERALETEDLVLEFMLNALRLTNGFHDAMFTARTGLPLSVAEPSLTRAEERGLLWRLRGRTGPTELGKRFLDDLVALFIPDAH